MSGFRRAIRDYKFYNVLYNMLGEVKKGRIDEGIRYSKDGTSIEDDEQWM